MIFYCLGCYGKLLHKMWQLWAGIKISNWLEISGNLLQKRASMSLYQDFLLPRILMAISPKKSNIYNIFYFSNTNFLTKVKVVKDKSSGLVKKTAFVVFFLYLPKSVQIWTSGTSEPGKSRIKDVPGVQIWAHFRRNWKKYSI